MTEKYSMARVRIPDEVLLPSAFTYGEDVFRDCFKFSRDDGYEILMQLAIAAHFDAERHKTLEKHSFDIVLFSTISYLCHGELTYLVKHHETYKKLLKKELMEYVPKVCLTIILLWTEQYICFPIVVQTIKTRLKNFKDKNCRNVIGIMDSYYFEVKKFSKVIFKGAKSVLMCVQFICDERGRFLDIFSTFNPLLKTKTQTWQVSNARKAIKSITLDFDELFLATVPDYPPDDPFLLTPYSKRLREKDRLAYDPHIVQILDRAMFDLKSRFKVLSGGIPFHHQETFYIINACVILQNVIMAKNMNVILTSHKRK